jgi:hypothetical protein
MLRSITTITIFAAVSLALPLGVASTSTVQGTGETNEASAALRIGTYDNRAIGIAFAASQFNPVAAKMKEYHEAKAAGNTARVKELDAWGQQVQRELHRQGFARVPVGDLLEPVKVQLPALATRLGVQAIAFDCNYTSPCTQSVDVTLELVKLYEPSEQTMKWVTESLKREPVDLDEIDRVKE